MLLFSTGSSLAQDMKTINNNAIIFEDVTENYGWAKDAINKFAQMGIVQGVAEGKFAPDEMVTREQFAKMLTLTFNISLISSEEPSFMDVKKDKWSYPYIEACKDFLTGYSLQDGSELYYASEETAIREDIAAALVRIMSLIDENTYSSDYAQNTFKDANDISNNLLKHVSIAAECGLIMGYDDGTFKPKKSITRAETVVLLNRAIDTKSQMGIISEQDMAESELVLDKSFVSLQVGQRERINANKPVIWVSDNPRVVVDEDGWVEALEDALRPDGQATITATAGDETVTCDITIVTWKANKNKLSVVKQFDFWRWFGLIDNVPHMINDSAELFVTHDDYDTLTKVADLPVVPTFTPILSTPRGYFMRGEAQVNTNIYHSLDLKSWELVYEASDNKYGLYHSFDYYYDNLSDTVFVYAVEYSLVFSERHKVHRGTITSDGKQTWEPILELYSAKEFNADNSKIPACNHIHIVSIDKSNGDVYVGTGDQNELCWIFYSSDNGDNFRALGGGKSWGQGLDEEFWGQAWRTLSIWFTDDYVYWNMDAGTSPQRIWRLSKEKIPEQNPNNDLKELAAHMQNGSLWYHFWINEDTIIMSGAPEGSYRDYRGRIFAIKMLPGGDIEVEEVYSIASPTGEYNAYTQLLAVFYHNGYCYFKGTDAEYNGMWKMRLEPIND
jgi:hypothetical protein